MAQSTVNKTPLSYTSGTDGIWKYHKFDDGTYHAWYEGGINLQAGAAWGTSGLYYHLAASVLNPPSFSTSVTSVTGSQTGAVLSIFCGVGTGNATYWANGTSGALNNVLVRIDMYGTW